MNRGRGEDACSVKRERKELTPHGHAESVVYGYATWTLLMTVLQDGILECNIYLSYLLLCFHFVCVLHLFMPLPTMLV